MNPVNLSVKERMNGINQNFGMRKKTITCTSTRNGFFKKIATSKFLSVMIFCLLQILQPGIC